MGLIETFPFAGPTHTDLLTYPLGEPITAGHTSPPTGVPPTDTILTFLTINAQKAGANSPSRTDIVTLLDDHSPDILFFTETPLHTRNGAMLHVLRNRGYHIHYHRTDTLPETRTPAHLTHAGGGSWLAYTKTAPWSSTVRPLTLPADCPRSTTCVVEITLLTGAKAAFIECYLPQPLEDHAQVCKALTNLPQALPHHVLIMGGDLQGD
jgi:hypothetical protein